MGTAAARAVGAPRRAMSENEPTARGPLEACEHHVIRVVGKAFGRRACIALPTPHGRLGATGGIGGQDGTDSQLDDCESEGSFACVRERVCGERTRACPIGARGSPLREYAGAVSALRSHARVNQSVVLPKVDQGGGPHHDPRGRRGQASATRPNRDLGEIYVFENLNENLPARAARKNL